MGFDPGRQFLGTGHKTLAGEAAAALDAASHGFDAGAQEILKLRHARVNVVGDGTDAALEALMNFLEPGGDGVRQMGAAAFNSGRHAQDALVDCVNRLRGAIGERRGELRQTGINRLDCLRGTVSQCRGQCAEPGIDGCGDRAGAVVESLFERFEAAVDRLIEEIYLVIE